MYRFIALGLLLLIPCVAAQLQSSSEIVIEDSSSLIAEGDGRRIFGFNGTLRLGGFTCAQAGQIQLTANAEISDGEGWTAVAHDPSPLPVAPGAAPGPSWSRSFNMTVSIEQQKQYASNASVTVNVIFDGSLPPTCIATTTMPPATGNATIEISPSIPENAAPLEQTPSQSAAPRTGVDSPSVPMPFLVLVFLAVSWRRLRQWGPNVG